MPSTFRILTVLGVLFLTLFTANKMQGVRDLPTEVTLESLPKTIEDGKKGRWVSSPSEGLGIKELDILKLDQYVRRYYILTESEADGTGPAAVPVNAYVGYWKNQTGDYQGAKHSPSICLPSSGWVVEQRGVRSFTSQTSSNLKPFVARQVVGSIMGQKRLFTYWFFSGGETYYDEWKALLYLSFGALFKNRTDGGIVTLSVPFPRQMPEKEAEEVAKQVTDRFAQTFAVELSKVLEKQQNLTKE